MVKPERILRQADKELDKLYRLTIQSIEMTQQIYSALAALPKMNINKEQRNVINNKRMPLWDMTGKISDRATASQSGYGSEVKPLAKRRKNPKADPD